MLDIKTLEQLHIKSNNDFTTLKTPTSKNVIKFNDRKIKVTTNKHDPKKQNLNYMFSYQDLEKWSVMYEHSIPSLPTLLKLFNDIK